MGANKRSLFIIALSLILLVSGLGLSIVSVTVPLAFIWMYLLDFFKHKNVKVIKIIGIFLLMNQTIILLALNENTQAVDYITILTFIGCMWTSIRDESSRKKLITISE